MVQVRFNKVESKRNPLLGSYYHIVGDWIYASNKKDCSYRIRSLCRLGEIDEKCRDNLLNQLKELKRA